MARSDKVQSDKEIAKRRDEVLRRMLKSPPKPHKEMTGKGKRKDATRKRQSGKGFKQGNG